MDHDTALSIDGRWCEVQPSQTPIFSQDSRHLFQGPGLLLLVHGSTCGLAWKGAPVLASGNRGTDSTKHSASRRSPHAPVAVGGGAPFRERSAGHDSSQTEHAACGQIQVRRKGLRCLELVWNG